METKIIRDEKTELNVEFSEIDNGQLNLIKEALWEDSAVDTAGFRINHPEVGKPVFFLRTKGKQAKKVWNDAIAKLTKNFESIKKELKTLK